MDNYTKQKGEIMKKATFSTDKYFVDIVEVENKQGYQNFLEFAFSYADSFCLSIYTNEKLIDLQDFRKTKWGYLNDSILDYEYTHKSPVTQGPEVILIYFKIDHVTTNFLKGKKTIYDFNEGIVDNKIYNWLWDLAFLKDNKFFFTSCTHEEFCSIDPNVLELYHNQLDSD